MNKVNCEKVIVPKTTTDRVVETQHIGVTTLPIQWEFFEHGHVILQMVPPGQNRFLLILYGRRIRMAFLGGQHTRFGILLRNKSLDQGC